MRIIAIVINILLILIFATLLFFSFSKGIDLGVRSPVIGQTFILLLAVATLYYLFRGGNKILKYVLVFINVLLGVLIYIPFIQYVMTEDSDSIIAPVIIALVTLPFFINAYALFFKVK